MKIAIISDIHANFPALEETLKSIQENDVDVIYCLGDLVGYNIWPNAVISEIKKHKIPTIAGNHDVKAVELHKKKSFKTSSSIAYQMIAKENVDFLETLPANIKLEFNNMNMILVHGSPYSNTEYLHEDREERDIINMHEDTKTNIIVCGHTHIPYHRVIKNQNNSFYHVINAGSVGKPKDGNPKSCYALITIDKNANGYDKDDVKVKFIRVKYDIQKVTEAILNSDLPEVYASMLKRAYWFVWKKE